MQTNIRNQIQQMTNIQLKQDDFIGKGSFANVYRYKINNTMLAVKCFEDQNKAEQENVLLQKIYGLIPNCPGVIQYYGIQKLEIEIIGQFSGSYTGYAIFFEACVMDFSKMLGIVKKLKTKEVFNLLSQMSLSLLCLHLNNCIHGDIKPSNILVNQNGSQQNIYYLTDFGEGKIVNALKYSDIKTLTLRGSPFYFAPELWYIYNKGEERFKYNPLASDIYALGIVILELLVGISPILKLNIARLNSQQYENELQNIKNMLKLLPEFQNNNELLEMLLKMVNFEAQKRPKIIEICQALINQKQFQMDVLSNINLQAIIIQLISFFNQPIQHANSQPLIPQPDTIYIQPNIPLPSFKSDILKDSLYSTMILALFEKQSISLSRIHAQFNLNLNFNAKKFHNDCDDKGSTLVIMHSNKEPNSFFGGMAAPSWNSKNQSIADPVGECSWLFKIEIGNSLPDIHQWKCIKKDQAIYAHKDYGPIFTGGISGYSGSYSYGYIGIESLNFLKLPKIFWENSQNFLGNDEVFQRFFHFLLYWFHYQIYNFHSNHQNILLSIYIIVKPSLQQQILRKDQFEQQNYGFVVLTQELNQLSSKSFKRNNG